MKVINYFKDGIYDYLFSLLIFFLPFSNSLPNLVMGVLIIIFILKFKKDYLNQFITSPYLILFFLTIYILSQSIFNLTFLQDFGFYKKYLYLLIIPILFLKVEKFQLLKNIAIVSINLSISISLFKIAKFYNDFHYLPFGDGWATNQVLVLERPYAGIFSIISIILSYDQLKTNNKNKLKLLYLLSLLISIFFILFIAIRISTLTIFLLFFIYTLFYLRISNKKKLIFILSIVLVMVGVFVFNKNISKRFFINETIDKTITTTKSLEPRVIIWGCAKEITKQDQFSIFFGTDSYSNIKNSLDSCYQKSIDDYSRRNWFMEKQFNTHSQFIDLYLIGGIIAIIILFFFLIKGILYNYRDFSTVAIILSFIMIMSIENIFHRQFGCLIFTIFTGLYLNSKRTNGITQS